MLVIMHHPLVILRHMSIPTHAFPLHMRPRLVQCGLCLHGAKAMESHCQKECWSLHFYHYTGTVKVGGTTFPFHSGYMSLIPPKCEAEWHFPPHASHYYAHFKCGIPKGRNGVQIPMIRPSGSLPPGLGNQFDELILHFNAGDRLRANVRLWDILFQIARPDNVPPSTANLHPKLQIALAVIRNSADQNLSVRRIASGMGVSRNHLTRLFQKEFQCGAKEYLRRERVGRALALMAHSSLSIKSIALASGFPDLAYFNKIIRRETGCSPRSYRIRLRRAGSEPPAIRNTTERP